MNPKEIPEYLEERYDRAISNSSLTNILLFEILEELIYQRKIKFQEEIDK